MILAVFKNQGSSCKCWALIFEMLSFSSWESWIGILWKHFVSQRQDNDKGQLQFHATLINVQVKTVLSEVYCKTSLAKNFGKFNLSCLLNMPSEKSKLQVLKGSETIIILTAFFYFYFSDHYNGYTEFNDEPFDSSRLRGRPDVKKLGKVSTVVPWCTL